MSQSSYQSILNENNLALDAAQIQISGLDVENILALDGNSQLNEATIGNGLAWTYPELKLDDSYVRGLVSATAPLTYSSSTGVINASFDVANGIPTLDSSGLLRTNQFPLIAINEIWTVADETAQLALTAQEGDIAVRTDENKSYCHNGGTAGTMADWTWLRTPTDLVLSVNGQTGAVVLDTDDVSEGVSNLYYTNARARGAISVGSSSLTYNSGTGVLDTCQGITTASSPLFKGLSVAVFAPTFSALSAGGLVKANGSGQLGLTTIGSGLDYTGSTLSNTGVLSITGTANQVIASASTGAVTLSTPQNIGTSSNVQFGNVLASGYVGSDGTVRITGTQTALAFQGDIDGAKVVQKLGGYRWSVCNDYANSIQLTGNFTLDGRTYRDKFAVDYAGEAFAAAKMNATSFVAQNIIPYYKLTSSPLGTNTYYVGANISDSVDGGVFIGKNANATSPLISIEPDKTTVGNTSQTYSTLRFQSTTTGDNYIRFNDGSDAGYIQYSHTYDQLLTIVGSNQLRMDTSRTWIPNNIPFSAYGYAAGYINMLKCNTSDGVEINNAKMVVASNGDTTINNYGSGQMLLAGYGSGRTVLRSTTGNLCLEGSGNKGIEISSNGTISAICTSTSTGLGTGGNGMWLQNNSNTTNAYYEIMFNGANNTYAEIAGQCTDQTNSYGDIAFATRGSSNYDERMRITSSGNVRMGTSSNYSQHVENGANPYFKCQNSAGVITAIGSPNAGYGNVGTASNHEVRIITNDTARITVSASGDATQTGYNLQAKACYGGLQGSLATTTLPTTFTKFVDFSTDLGNNNFTTSTANDKLTCVTTGMYRITVDCSGFCYSSNTNTYMEFYVYINGSRESYYFGAYGQESSSRPPSTTSFTINKSITAGHDVELYYKCFNVGSSPYMLINAVLQVCNI